MKYIIKNLAGGLVDEEASEVISERYKTQMTVGKNVLIKPNKSVGMRPPIRVPEAYASYISVNSFSFQNIQDIIELGDLLYILRIPKLAELRDMGADYIEGVLGVENYLLTDDQINNLEIEDLYDVDQDAGTVTKSIGGVDIEYIIKLKSSTMILDVFKKGEGRINNIVFSVSANSLVDVSGYKDVTFDTMVGTDNPYKYTRLKKGVGRLDPSIMTIIQESTAGRSMRRGYISPIDTVSVNTDLDATVVNREYNSPLISDKHKRYLYSSELLMSKDMRVYNKGIELGIADERILVNGTQVLNKNFGGIIIPTQADLDIDSVGGLPTDDVELPDAHRVFLLDPSVTKAEIDPTNGYERVVSGGTNTPTNDIYGPDGQAQSDFASNFEFGDVRYRTDINTLLSEAEKSDLLGPYEDNDDIRLFAHDGVEYMHRRSYESNKQGIFKFYAFAQLGSGLVRVPEKDFSFTVATAFRILGIHSKPKDSNQDVYRFYVDELTGTTITEGEYKATSYIDFDVNTKAVVTILTKLVVAGQPLVEQLIYRAPLTWDINDTPSTTYDMTANFRGDPFYDFFFSSGSEYQIHDITISDITELTIDSYKYIVVMAHNIWAEERSYYDSELQRQITSKDKVSKSVIIIYDAEGADGILRWRRAFTVRTPVSSQSLKHREYYDYRTVNARFTKAGIINCLNIKFQNETVFGSFSLATILAKSSSTTAISLNDRTDSSFKNVTKPDTAIMGGRGNSTLFYDTEDGFITELAWSVNDDVYVPSVFVVSDPQGFPTFDNDSPWIQDFKDRDFLERYPELRKVFADLKSVLTLIPTSDGRYMAVPDVKKIQSGTDINGGGLVYDLGDSGKAIITPSVKFTLTKSVDIDNSGSARGLVSDAPSDMSEGGLGYSYGGLGVNILYYGPNSPTEDITAAEPLAIIYVVLDYQDPSVIDFMGTNKSYLGMVSSSSKKTFLSINPLTDTSMTRRDVNVAQAVIETAYAAMPTASDKVRYPVTLGVEDRLSSEVSVSGLANAEEIRAFGIRDVGASERFQSRDYFVDGTDANAVSGNFYPYMVNPRCVVQGATGSSESERDILIKENKIYFSEYGGSKPFSDIVKLSYSSILNKIITPSQLRKDGVAGRDLTRDATDAQTIEFNDNSNLPDNISSVGEHGRGSTIVATSKFLYRLDKNTISGLLSFTKVSDNGFDSSVVTEDSVFIGSRSTSLLGLKYQEKYQNFAIEVINRYNRAVTFPFTIVSFRNNHRQVAILSDKTLYFMALGEDREFLGFTQLDIGLDIHKIFKMDEDRLGLSIGDDREFYELNLEFPIDSSASYTDNIDDEKPVEVHIETNKIRVLTDDHDSEYDGVGTSLMMLSVSGAGDFSYKVGKNEEEYIGYNQLEGSTYCRRMAVRNGVTTRGKDTKVVLKSKNDKYFAISQIVLEVDV